MIRRFNFTNRIKINRTCIEISLHENNEGKYFTAYLNLDGTNFPSEAKVYIEANYKGIYQRFEFGTVGNIREPYDTRLNELPDTELVFFDVLVVDEKGKTGLLLGKAKGLAAKKNDSPSDRLPILPVNPADLGQQFWKLTFDQGQDGRPVLEINRKIPDVFELARNDIKFISLVYPVAFRGVLVRMLEIDEYDMDEDSWVGQWIKFISTVLGIKHLPEADSDDGELTIEQEIWIDDCVNSFCKKLKLFERFTSQ